MMAIHRLRRPARPDAPVVLAAGFFDGVHVGHRNVVAAAVRAARPGRAEVWVLTFDVHPEKIVRPGEAPLILTSTEHKMRLLSDLGVDACAVLRFTPSLARMAPERFVRRLKRAIPGLVRVVIGRNWTFGRGGAGNAALLRRLGCELGFSVEVVPQVRRLGVTVSSTRIRRDVEAGRLAKARAMLGRPFSILGTVVHGRGLGRKLGIPTANLDPHNEVRPPLGVYAVRALVRGRLLDGVANIGVRPTVAAGSPPVLELYLPGVRMGLYGGQIEVFFLRRLRPERRFRSLAALKAQILRDTAAALRFLRRSSSETRPKK